MEMKYKVFGYDSERDLTLLLAVFDTFDDCIDYMAARAAKISCYYKEV